METPILKADPEVGTATPVAPQAPPDPTLPWKALSLTFFLAGIALAAGVASSGGGGGGSDDDAAAPSSSSAFPTLALDSKTVHWGYFSKYLQPVMTVASGDTVTVEMATHHACDDWDKMIKDDPGMESVFSWDTHTKREAFRGATGGGDCQCINQIVAARPPLLNHWQATHWLICAQATACTCSRARSSSRGPSPAIY